MRRLLIMCGAISMLFIQIAEAQDNNQSIGEELKKVWGGDQGEKGTWLSMDGMYDTQASTENTDEIGFADDVASTPIDGGLGLLLAAGVIVGARRIRREVKNTKEVENKLSE